MAGTEIAHPFLAVYWSQLLVWQHSVVRTCQRRTEESSLCMSTNFRVHHLSAGQHAVSLRKYRVGFDVAHQYLQQLTPEIRHSALGNIGTVIAFRLGAEDAPYISHEFQPLFDELDLTQLDNHQIYLKLMIDGSPSLPFSARTIAITIQG
jgi:hypothetical protein